MTAEETSAVQETRVLPNGAIQDVKTGRIVKGAPGQAWDSKRAREMALKRGEMMRQETRKAILDAMNEGVPAEDIVKSFPKAHRKVVQALMAEIVMNPKEKGKVRMDVYTGLLNMEGSMGKVGKEGLQQEGMTISFSPEVAKHLVDGIMRWKNKAQAGGEVVDATFVESNS